mmetsp:Transcript_51633/g.125958  ORF Transcript_51633/g.125958 Transcript_51633/m.125958 type:complete len:211 (-) Transcript_51633:610-1242(-)
MLTLTNPERTVVLIRKGACLPLHCPLYAPMSAHCAESRTRASIHTPQPLCTPHAITGLLPTSLVYLTGPVHAPTPLSCPWRAPRNFSVAVAGLPSLLPLLVLLVGQVPPPAAPRRLVDGGRQAHLLALAAREVDLVKIGPDVRHLHALARVVAARLVVVVRRGVCSVAPRALRVRLVVQKPAESVVVQVRLLVRDVVALPHLLRPQIVEL